MSLVYDCFLFFNEFDLLEIRLNILSETVDKFVLVEANKTFSNKEKPFYFEEARDKFSQFHSKIIHIKISTYPETKTAWDMEHYQRNQIARGIEQCSNDDIILISDLDEIPNPEAIEKYKKYCEGIYKLEQLHFDYYLNYQRWGKNYYWYPAKIARYRNIIANNYMPQNIRSKMDIKKIKDGGWHFSFLGGMESIKYKIQSFAHQEWNIDTYVNDQIEYKIRMGLDLFGRKNIRLVPIKISSKKFPQYIVNNIEKYQHLIYKPINHYLACKNMLYCFPFIIKSEVKQILKYILPKSILKTIKSQKKS